MSALTDKDAQRFELVDEQPKTTAEAYRLVTGTAPAETSVPRPEDRRRRAAR